MGSDDLPLRGLEANRVDVVRPDPDQEELFEMALPCALPREQEVAGPYRCRDRVDIDDVCKEIG
jgi:hypothetical protein